MISDKPSEPVMVKVTEVYGHELKLEWEAPEDDGGSEVTKYVIQMWSGSDEVWADAGESKDTSFMVKDLDTDQEYQFKLAAENDVGRGDFSTSGICKTKSKILYMKN